MRDGDAVHSGGFIENCRGKDGLYDTEYNQQNNNADNVEHQVYHGRPFGIFRGADGGDDGRDTGADILSHDDGNGGGVADLSGQRQGLQNTHRGRAGLDYGSQNSAHQNAQNGVSEHDEQLREARNILQSCHSAAHGIHAEHQRGKTQQDHAGVLFSGVLTEHVEDDADQGQYRREGGGFQKIDPNIAAVDPGETQQPRGDRGAYVGAHDHIDSLPQRHQS